MSACKAKETSSAKEKLGLILSHGPSQQTSLEKGIRTLTGTIDFHGRRLLASLLPPFRNRVAMHPRHFSFVLSCVLALSACSKEAPDFDKLMAGIQAGNIGAVRAELDKGFGQERLNEFDGKDVPMTPLHLAALNGQTQIQHCCWIQVQKLTSNWRMEQHL